MIRYQLLLGVALFVGVAVGFFLAPKEGAPAAEPLPVAASLASTKAIADQGGKASERALRARIAELERELAATRRATEEVVSNAVAKVASAPPPRWNPRERMEQLRKNDPQRYTEMTNRFARWRAARRERQAARQEFFSSIDTSGFSPAARKTHEELQDLLARREEIESRMQDPDLADADRDALMRELWGSAHRLNELNGRERENLLRETVKAVGFEGEAAEELYSTVQEVFEATQGEHGFGHRGGHRGGPGGGRGGPPPAGR